MWICPFVQTNIYFNLSFISRTCEITTKQSPAADNETNLQLEMQHIFTISHLFFFSKYIDKQRYIKYDNSQMVSGHAMKQFLSICIIQRNVNASIKQPDCLSCEKLLCFN